MHPQLTGSGYTYPLRSDMFYLKEMNRYDTKNAIQIRNSALEKKILQNDIVKLCANLLAYFQSFKTHEDNT